MIELAKRITKSNLFQLGIIALILLTGILSGIETYLDASADSAAIRTISNAQDVILWIFVAEILLKILACGSNPWAFFRNWWNLFDFAIVSVCLLPLDVRFSAVLRMARLVRTLRLVSILPRLQLLVGALLKSIPSLGYIGVLLGLHFYVYAVIGTFLFRQNDPLHFGSLHEAFLTLFQILTLEGWNEILAIQYLGSDLVYDDGVKAVFDGVRQSQAQPLVAAAYFVTFIMMGTMIMLNLFTGVIITSMEEASSEAAQSKRQRNAERGFLTLRDELSMVSQKLKELSSPLDSLEAPEGVHSRVSDDDEASLT